MIKKGNLEGVWEQLIACDHQKQAAYPFIKQPGIYVDAKTNEQYIVLGMYSLHLSEYESGEITVIEPVIYQSCMQPDEVWIYPLEIKKEGDEALFVSCHYECYHIPLDKMQLEILPWEAVIKRANCSKCINCGRCSW